MFFSGNTERSPNGVWRTGMAISEHPAGPFRVARARASEFLNGSTIRFHGAFLQAANAWTGLAPVFYRSRNGRTWERRFDMPVPQAPSWRYWQSDMFLEARSGGFDAFFAGRVGPTGADIGLGVYRDGRWRRFRRILQREPGWDALDLGEPASFTWRGTRFLLYAGLPLQGGARSIGLARLTSRGWRRCGDAPLITAGTSWFRGNAIDPEPLVIGHRLYVYFGGGIRPSLGGGMDGKIGLRVYDLVGGRQRP